MLLVSHKMVFIENEAGLLCVTMRERAKAFAATILCTTFWYSFCHHRVQFLWCTFQRHFGMRTRHFQKVVLRMKLFPSLQSFICHIANIEVWKYVFTRVIIKIKIFHSCRARAVPVAFVSYFCRSCNTRVRLVSHSCCSCLAPVLWKRTDRFGNGCCSNFGKLTGNIYDEVHSCQVTSFNVAKIALHYFSLELCQIVRWNSSNNRLHHWHFLREFVVLRAVLFLEMGLC